MLTWVALGLLAAALVLFLNWRHHSRMGGLPAGELVFADHAQENCVVLVSHRCELKGKPDALVRTPEGALVPIERKKARARIRPYEADLIQAAADCLLVEEHYGQSPPFMRIQYADRWFDEPFTTQHRQRVLDVSQCLREARRATAACNRSHHMAAKCRRCTQRMHCGQSLYTPASDADRGWGYLRRARPTLFLRKSGNARQS